jgi:long-chain acyl-CoA synthetase
VPDDMLGEEVGAAIALAAGIEADAVAIRDFVKDRVERRVAMR